MALVKCHECGTEVSSKAKACPSCGAKPKRKLSVLKWGAGIFVAFIAYGAYVDSNMTPEQKAARAEARAAREAEDVKQAAEKKAHDDEKACSNQTTAFVMSQSFVKQRLKAPASADFPYVTDDGVKTSYRGDCTHEVLAYVDSQNSFGAKIRTKYYVKLKNQKGTDDWRLLDIKISE